MTTRNLFIVPNRPWIYNTVDFYGCNIHDFCYFKFMKLIYTSMLAMLLLLASCGDRPKEESKNFVNTGCVIDPEILEQILKVDAISQLECLEKNFNAFERYVERENRDYISQDQLGNFISKFFQKNSAKIFSAMKLFFKINMLVLNDQPNHISTANIKKLTTLLITSNKEAIQLSSILKNISNENFNESRQQLIESLNRFKKTILDIIEVEKNERSNLNIKDFLKDLNNIEGVDLDVETIEAFLFLKKLLVGGEPHIITGQELKDFITKLPDLATLGFDLYFTSIKNFKNDNELFAFYAKKTANLQSLIFTGDRTDVLFNVDDLIVILQKLPGNTLDMTKFKNSLMVFKEKFLGGDPSLYTFDDFLSFFSDVGYIFRMIYFNYVTYDNEEIFAIMEKDIPIVSLPKLDSQEYNLTLDSQSYVPFSLSELKKLQENLDIITAKTRLFRDSSGLQFFTKDYRRTKYGLNETSIIRWVVNRLHTSYGKKRETSAGNEYFITLPILERFLKDFKPLLQELDLWTSDQETLKFAENTLNLADLFQTNSNGDIMLDVSETTEYTSLVGTAIKVGTDIRSELLKVCPNHTTDDAKPGFKVDCFRKNYFSIIFDTLKYEGSFVTLFDYYKKSSPEERMAYLKKVEMFARDDISPPALIGNNDIIKIFGALLCIESATIRFDLNKSNILESEEVDRSFSVYENIIKKLTAESKSSTEKSSSPAPEEENKYGLSTYKFLLKYMRPPSSTWEFLKFHFSLNKKVQAERINVGSLLCYVVRGDECSKPMLDPLRINQ